jgi:L-lactate dehydrogenase complex protein LldG
MASEPTSRESFLESIRDALGRRTAAPPALDDHRDAVRLVGRGAATPDLFLQRAAAVGMSVQRLPLRSLREYLPGLPFQRPSISIEDAELRTAVEYAIRGVAWRSAPALDALYEADAGITDVFAAIAETGTLVVRSSPLTTRGGFLVPPIHVALVRASRIIPDMVDLWALLDDMPTSVVLITGPSKTADIEGILVTGVHGPKEVRIILIDDA